MDTTEPSGAAALRAVKAAVGSVTDEQPNRVAQPAESADGRTLSTLLSHLRRVLPVRCTEFAQNVTPLEALQILRGLDRFIAVVPQQGH